MNKEELMRKWPHVVRDVRAFRTSKGLVDWPEMPASGKLPVPLHAFVDEATLMNIPSHLRSAAVPVVDPLYARDYVDRYNGVIEHQLSWIPGNREERQADIALDFALDLAVQAGFGVRYERAEALD